MAANGDLIRRLRIEQGLSVRALAEAAGVNPGYLSRVERGQANPTTRWVADVAAAYGVPTTTLLLPDEAA